LAKLWGKLYRRNFDEDSKKCTHLIGSWLSTILIFLSFFGMLALAIMDGLPIGNNSWKSWFNFLGLECYSIVVVRFMIGPFVVPINCAFAVLLTTFHHLLKVYERYCQKVHEILLSAGANYREKTHKNEQNCSSFKMNMNRWRMTADLKRKLVIEFQEVQELFMLSEKVLSPMVLLIFTGGSLRLVISASKIVLRNTSNFWDLVLFKDAAHLVIIGCHLFLIRTGQRMLDIVRYTNIPV